MSEPDLRWTTHDAPDLLVLQPAPVPAVSGGRPVDVLRALFARRGFAVLAEPVDGTGHLDLPAATGCLLTDDGGEAALLVTVGEAGATRFALPGLDAAWWGRAEALGHAGVLVVTTAVGEDGASSGATDRADLRAALRDDVAAGGVLAALVPVGSLDPGA